MGSRIAPSLANLFMVWFEAGHVRGPDSGICAEHILYWGRFIDDVLMIWAGTETQLLGFIDYLTSNPYHMHFTSQYNTSKITFLDIGLLVAENK